MARCNERDFSNRISLDRFSRGLDPTDRELISFLDRLHPGRIRAGAAMCRIRSEQAPNPDSRVQPGQERDALGQRRVLLDWRLTDLDRHNFVKAAQLYSSVVTRSGIGRIKLVPWLFANDDRWWRRIAAGWHHMGTTRMAEEETKGVVDKDCRVFGLDNLYVAGASVFPTVSYSNPTLTLVALTIRLADHLKRQRA